jgi:hypothetical protein
VRDERRKVLERLVAPGEVDRGSCEALLGDSATNDRCGGRQRRCNVALDSGTAQDDGSRAVWR